MKSLDLQQIGLQELTKIETRSVDGGFLCTSAFLCVAAVAAIASYIYVNVAD